MIFGAAGILGEVGIGAGNGGPVLGDSGGVADSPFSLVVHSRSLLLMLLLLLQVLMLLLLLIVEGVVSRGRHGCCRGHGPRSGASGGSGGGGRWMSGKTQAVRPQHSG